jgi:hypothetical protein
MVQEYDSIFLIAIDLIAPNGGQAQRFDTEFSNDLSRMRWAMHDHVFSPSMIVEIIDIHDGISIKAEDGRRRTEEEGEGISVSVERKR